MSTFAYAAITGARKASKPGTSTTTGSPGIKTYMDALAALVPAEVLTAHAAILTFTTETVTEQGITVVKVTHPETLVPVFYALMGMSIILYVVGRLMSATWDKWDWLRMLIPSLAFVGWTMLQKATAFDAVASGLSQPNRSAMAIIGGILLGVLATALAYKADQKPAR